MHMTLFSAMLLAGAMIAIQPVINARLAQKVGVLQSASISFFVGTVALLIAASLVGKGDWRGVGETVWWEWSGGLFGAFFVAATIFAVPRIGTAATMAAVIASQLITGTLLDHYGFFGFRNIPFDLRRLAGAGLLLCGAWLIMGSRS